jgi:hypothetical protein
MEGWSVLEIEEGRGLSDLGQPLPGRVVGHLGVNREGVKIGSGIQKEHLDMMVYVYLYLFTWALL